ncbi:MAG: hypothetical protein WBC33_11650 [Conexibacter sp.]
MSNDRLEEFQLDCYDTPDREFEVPVRAFLRRIGIPHVFDELLRPTMEEGSTLVALAVRQRPWPPWGIGARSVSALALATPVGDTSAGLASVLTVPEEAAAVELQAAVHHTLLEGLVGRGVERVHFVVKEGSPFGERIVAGAGFEPTSNLVLTEEARYWLHEANLSSHRQAIGIDNASADELITGEALDNGAFERAALFLLGVSRALEPWWREDVRSSEIIANTGPGRVAECLPPGGPPRRVTEEAAS